MIVISRSPIIVMLFAVMLFGTVLFAVVLFAVVLFGVPLFSAMVVRATPVRGTHIRTMFSEALVPARLRKLLPHVLGKLQSFVWWERLRLSRPRQATRSAFVGARGIRSVLAEYDYSARRQYRTQRQYGICSTHDLLALGERDPPSIHPKAETFSVRLEHL
jgi:hypothetical protein